MPKNLKVKCGVLAVVILGLVAPGIAAASTAPQSDPPLKWGMNVAAVDPLIAEGAKPDYAMMWVGVWNDGNWNAIESTLASLRDKGVTPVIQWYYWGDDISPECVENGCWSSLHGAHKSRERWDAMSHELAARVESVMGGREVVIIVETEFNKNGIVDTWYAPTFDAYMAGHHSTLGEVPGVTTVTGFGTWYSQGWARFPESVAASDYVAMQALRSSVRSTESDYLAAVDVLVSSAKELNKHFPGKPVFITDMGYSSYPEPEYAEHQHTVITEFFARKAELQSLGVQAFMYRGLFDVNMNTANYHGEAERWWGLKHQDGTAKPAFQSWLVGVDARPPPPPPGVTVPARLEAEAMDASTGGLQKDGAASGGAAWNLWANGHLTQYVNATDAGTYRFTITARGSSAFDEWPAMRAELGGTTVGQWSVASSSYARFTFDASLAAGESTQLRVVFTNDKYDPATNQDRNLVVDRVDVDVLTKVNAAPTAAFEWTADGRTVMFDANASEDPDGDALAYAWRFGDAGNATGVAPEFTFPADGAFNVTLTVTDARGAVDAVTHAVAVARPNAAPHAAFAWNASGLTVTFDANASTDADGDALTFAWDFGDGNVTTGSAPAHAFGTEGTYTVTLNVTDARGASHVITKDVSVVRPNTAPAPAFTWAARDLEVTLDASGTTDAENDPVTFEWTLGDGSKASGRSVTHAFADGGEYRVTLRTTDDRGASASVTKTVTVTRPNAAPSASFTATATGLTVAFDASASSDADGDALTFAWDFGDESTATGPSATKTYARAGTFTVKLTVSDGTASTFVTRNVTVQEPVQYPVRVEAEDFGSKSTGGRFSDASASGGAAWNVWSNGAIRHDVSVPEAGTHVVTVIAKGSPAAGENARMDVRVDGVTVATFDVTTSWSAYRVRVPLSAGTHGLAVVFTNDHYDSRAREDRNLHVDVVSVDRAPTFHTTREAEGFAVKTTGGQFSDATASGSARWNVWANGHIEDAFSVDATGTYRFGVVAKGDPAAGAQARMQVRVDGELVLDRFVTSDWTSHTGYVHLTQGSHVVRVAFVNDHYDPSTGQDRNLHVDVVRFRAS